MPLPEVVIEEACLQLHLFDLFAMLVEQVFPNKFWSLYKVKNLLSSIYYNYFLKTNSVAC